MTAPPRVAVTRWLVAGLLFVGIGLVDVRYGHGPAFFLMMAALLVVALFGGSGRHGAPEDDVDSTASDPEASEVSR